jgi:hypothetical protein
MKQVYIAKDPTDAYLVKGMLEQYGVACQIRGEQLWNARGQLPLTTDTLPTLWVIDDNKYEEAARLVTAYENGTLAENAGGPWKCPACGEEIEGQFTDCWQCGASRPSETQLESQ